MTVNADACRQVLNFWFKQLSADQWFIKNPDLDRQIRESFFDIYLQAAEGLLDRWADNPQGALALCIILDQFSRNMFRGTAQAFDTDPKARSVARQAIEKNFDQELTVQERIFIYLPFEHSECIRDQQESVRLFGAIKNEAPEAYDWAVKHLDIIEKFGRFPHRNAALGRESTSAEQDYLAQPGAGF